MPVIEVIKDIRRLCTHTFKDGHVCASPALRGETFCFYHHPTRKPAPSHRTRQRYLLRARRAGSTSFHLPIPTTQPELQLALTEIAHRIATNQIEHRHARLLLSALQNTARNL